MCDKALADVLNTTVKRIRRIRSIYQQGITTIQPTKPTGRKISEKHEQAILWMQEWFHLHGDKMPDSVMTHLPHYLTKEAVYKEMRDEMLSSGLGRDEVISLQRFYVLWTEKFKTVSIPKINRFAKCDTCVRYDAEKARLAGKQDELESLKEVYREHMKEFK